MRFDELARRTSYLSACALLCVLAWLLAPRGAWLVEGHLHDMMIGIHAGHLATDRPSHVTFHTSFGWVEPALQWVGWKLNRLWPDRELGRTVILSGLAFCALLGANYGLLRRLVGARCLPWWGLVALMLAALSLRQQTLVPQMPFLDWYSPYNHQLWAWWWLQLLFTLGFTRRHDFLAHGQRIITLAALAHAVFVFVAAHYKLNMGVGCACLALAASLGLPRWAALRFWLIVASAFSVGVAATALGGWDYVLWGRNLLAALQAKQSSNAVTGTLSIYVGLAAAGWFLLRLPLFVYNGDASRFAMRDAVILMGAVANSAANYPASLVPLCVAWCLVVVAGYAVERVGSLAQRPAQTVRMMAWIFLSLQIVQDGAGLTRLAWSKTHAPTGMKKVELQGSEGVSWRVWALAHMQNIEPGNTRRQIDQIVNRQFVDYLRDGSFLFYQHWPQNMLSSIRVASLELSNPFPWLVGATYPDTDLHWLDPGVTFSVTDAPWMLARYYAGSDAVLLPRYLTQDIAHKLIICHFLAWNRQQGEPFALVGETPAVRFYVRKPASPQAEPESSDVPIAFCPEEWPDGPPKLP